MLIHPDASSSEMARETSRAISVSTGRRVAQTGESPSSRLMHHLRHSGLPFADQAAALKTILRADPIVWKALELARDLTLPDGMVVSGAIYNSVWNSLTGKPSGHGIKDIDLFYCDGADLSYEAEDAVIRRAAAHFECLPLPVEVRNQARVHLWYPDRFGRICPAYRSSAEALGYFASRTHAVGVRLTVANDIDVIAPFGLDDIFSFRITPNRVMDNRETHEAKGERAVRLWPQITVEHW